MRRSLVPWFAALVLAGCGRPTRERVITPQQMADALYAVISADRAVYAREVVARLQDQEGVIRASEHYRDERALPLPAQMLRMGALAARKGQAGFSYALLSPWPIDKQNAPRTEEETAALSVVVQTGKAHYGEESLGGTEYFTAVYPDKAVSEACVACHNGHKDSPRHDFRVGEAMGGIVIRIPLE